MGDQITTASKQRLLRRLGVLSADDLAKVVKAVCGQLGI
jgi:mRNA-degrading endonuclease toxin of MazEF toxin-antitoxin module